MTDKIVIFEDTIESLPLLGKSAPVVLVGSWKLLALTVHCDEFSLASIATVIACNTQGLPLLGDILGTQIAITILNDGGRPVFFGSPPTLAGGFNLGYRAISVVGTINKAKVSAWLQSV